MGRMTSSLFQGSEYALELRQLHIACPQHRGVFAGEIAAQQIVSVALLGSLELRLVRVKRECHTRDFLIFLRKPDLHEPEGAPGLFLRRADAQQQLIAFGQTLSHSAQPAQKASLVTAQERFRLEHNRFRVSRGQQMTVNEAVNVHTTDPVCGMRVDPERAADQVEYQGQTYHFCSRACAGFGGFHVIKPWVLPDDLRQAAKNPSLRAG
jgi:hypothetical protein